MKKKDDISTGKNTWIVFEEITSREKMFSLDELLEPTISFWVSLETFCVSECCGIDAFDFHPQTIRDSAITINDKKLLFNLLELKTHLEMTENPTFVSTKLNNLFHRNTFLNLLQHIIDALQDHPTEGES